MEVILGSVITYTYAQTHTLLQYLGEKGGGKINYTRYQLLMRLLYMD